MAALRAPAKHDILIQGTHPCSQVALRQALILRMDVHQRLELRRAEQRLRALPRPRDSGSLGIPKPSLNPSPRSLACKYDQAVQGLKRGCLRATPPPRAQPNHALVGCLYMFPQHPRSPKPKFNRKGRGAPHARCSAASPGPWETENVSGRHHHFPENPIPSKYHPTRGGRGAPHARCPAASPGPWRWGT